MKIIREKIEIARNIIFLCGPYYDSEDSNDRRKVLQDYIFNEYKGAYLPLVIDDFLTTKNINDTSINIQLLEEIFAAIASQTIIFLDTMSSATELGLFANNGFQNTIYVLLPKTSDILNRNGVGYFVKEVVLKQNTSRIAYEYYRPKISRSAIASDLAVEHYGFINNTVPSNISSTMNEVLEKDMVQDIYYQNKPSIPKSNNQINYTFSKQKNEITIYISIKLLFYLVGAIYSEKNKEKLKKKEYFQEDVNLLINEINKLLMNSIEINFFLPLNNNSKIIIETSLAYSLYEIIKHFEKFMNLYYFKSKVRGMQLIYQPEKIIFPVDSGTIPKDFFNLEQTDFELIEDVNINNDKYIDYFDIKKNGKKRHLVKYSEDESGEKLRIFHKKIVKKLWETYSSNDCSFAYKTGLNIVGCVKSHIDSKYFLKYDISNFFNNINKDIFIDKLGDYFGFNDLFRKQITLIFGTSFFDNKMPLGLITSPIISDIYMHEFDCNIEKFSEDKGLTYTRYADDIMLSSYFEIGDSLKKEIENKVLEELKKIKLSLNLKKKQQVSFGLKGNHIKYLGINIVCKGSANMLSVGKKYAYDIAKDFMNYKKIEMSDSNYYFGKEIVGRYAFLCQVEGDNGIKKVIKRLEKMNAPKCWYEDNQLVL